MFLECLTCCLLKSGQVTSQFLPGKLFAAWKHGACSNAAVSVVDMNSVACMDVQHAEVWNLWWSHLAVTAGSW